MLKTFAALGALLVGGLVAMPASAAELTVQVVPDTVVCASAPQQCTIPNSGHTAEAATANNHNPIRIFVLVTKAGSPLQTLTPANFQFNNGLVPAGGGSAVICPEAICGPNRFGGGGVGLYQLFIDRAAPGNWKAGTYAATMRIVRGSDKGVGLLTYEIKG